MTAESIRAWRSDTERTWEGAHTSEVADPCDQKETILLVEDEDRVRRVMCEVLRSVGHRVLAAENADAALEACRDQEVRLLVCDLMLPGRNGRELARELRTRIPGLRTLFISGYGESLCLLGLERQVGVGYLSKPFSVAALVNAVARILRPTSHGQEQRPMRRGDSGGTPSPLRRYEEL